MSKICDCNDGPWPDQYSFCPSCGKQLRGLCPSDATACSACGGCTMLPGIEEDADLMNTPCWKCNEHAQCCGNCAHRGEIFNVPPLGDHLHCNHPVLEIRDFPPYGHGWGTLRNARETCDQWTLEFLPNVKHTDR